MLQTDLRHHTVERLRYCASVETDGWLGPSPQLPPTPKGKHERNNPKQLVQCGWDRHGQGCRRSANHLIHSQRQHHHSKCQTVADKKPG